MSRLRISGVLAGTVVGLGLLAAACGGPASGEGVASAGGSSAKTRNAAAKSTTDPQQASLDFAQCMRDHGVDMPDPEVNGGMVKVLIGPGATTDPATVDAAQQACSSIMGGPGDGPAKAGGSGLRITAGGVKS